MQPNGYYISPNITYQNSQKYSNKKIENKNKRRVHIIVAIVVIVVLIIIISVALGLIPLYLKTKAENSNQYVTSKLDDPNTDSLPSPQPFSVEKGSTDLYIEIIQAGTFFSNVRSNLVCLDDAKTYNFDDFETQSWKFLKESTNVGRYITTLSFFFNCKSSNEVGFSLAMNIKSSNLSFSQDVISYMINLYLISIFKLRLPVGISSFLKNEIDSIKINGDISYSNGTKTKFNNCMVKPGFLMVRDVKCILNFNEIYTTGRSTATQVLSASAQSTTRKATWSPRPTRILTLLPNQINCGQSKIRPSINGSSLSRIINGDPSVPHSWPWLVSVRIKYIDGTLSDHLCGGSLVYNAYYVLTSAHCLEEIYDPTNLVVVVGLHNLDEGANGFNTYNVQNFWVHPQYDPMKSYTNDIGILRLAKQPTQSYKVSPICLPEFDDVSIIFNKEVVMIGWGYTNSSVSTLSNILLQIVRRCINSIRLCRRNGITYMPQTTYCTVPIPSKIQDTCHGDSGGPMQVFLDGKWYIYGLTSFGDALCDPKLPSFYSMVPVHLRWLSAYIK